MIALEDRLAILDLYSRYNRLVDQRDHAWAEVFTKDGVFAARRRYQGHDELREYIDGLIAAAGTSPFVSPQHWNNNISLDRDGNIVRGSCYLLRVARERESGQLAVVTLGAYSDEIIKVDDQWLFALRSVTIL